MKAKLLFFTFAILFALPSFSQRSGGNSDRESRRQEFLEFKLDFLSKEIGLRDDQKKQFNELYTQMETERRAILKRIKEAEKTISGNPNATEADYERASREIASAKAEMAQLEQQYDERFSSFLTKKQIFKLHEAENQFMQRMQNCRDKKKKKRD